MTTATDEFYFDNPALVEKVKQAAIGRYTLTFDDANEIELALIANENYQKQSEEESENNTQIVKDLQNEIDDLKKEMERLSVENIRLKYRLHRLRPQLVDRGGNTK